uniref:Uncharacterized protein n=1 Tax=Anopheles farauti TaxID=69004 RepID=A0A182Q0P3_9DIPT
METPKGHAINSDYFWTPSGKRPLESSRGLDRRLPSECSVMFLVVCFLAVVLCWGVLGVYRQRQRLKKLSVHFGSPKPHWLLGNLLEFPANDIPGIFETMVDLHVRYGQDLFNWGLLNDHMIIVSSAANVEKVVMAKRTEKSQIYEFIEPWLGRGLLISKGEKWFHRRKIITPTFHFQILESFADVFNREATVLIEKLREHASSGQEFDIYEPISLYALDSICETSMGVEIDAQRNPDNQYVRDVKRMSELILLRIFHVLASFPRTFWYTMPNAWEQRKVIGRLHAFTDSVIHRRRQQLLAGEGNAQETPVDPDDPYGAGRQRQTFLDLLLNVTVDGKPLSDADIREEVDTFMFEGHDTTTSGIAFTFYQLAKHPDIQERLYQEIRDVLGADYRTVPLTYSTLQNFTYLDMVVKESLRLLPPVSFIGRRLVDDIEMNGVTIPAGTDFTIPIYVIHRNPAVYPDPERFDPERFSDDSNQRRGPYDYIPFSVGSRNCIGQRYALMEMKITIIQMLAHYRILPGERMPQVRLKTDLVLRPDQGIPIRLQNRPYGHHFIDTGPGGTTPVPEISGAKARSSSCLMPALEKTLVDDFAKSIHSKGGICGWDSAYVCEVCYRTVAFCQPCSPPTMSTVLFVLAVLVAFGCAQFYRKRRRLQRIAQYFDAVPPHWLLGNVMEYPANDIPGIFETMVDLHVRYGQDLFNWGLLNDHMIIVSSAANVEKVVMAKRTEKSQIYEFIEPWLGRDPERFDPERFSDDSNQRRGPYDYIPFSVGSRNCIGQRYALMEMKVAIVRMVSFYRILPGAAMHEIRLKTDLVLRPDKTIPIRIMARE